MPLCSSLGLAYLSDTGRVTIHWSKLGPLDAQILRGTVSFFMSVEEGRNSGERRAPLQLQTGEKLNDLAGSVIHAADAAVKKVLTGGRG